MFEAIILAGGFGTRLQSVLKDIPKAMAPVNGRPFLDYLLAWLKSFGISRVVLSVGYQSQVIVDHFGSHYKGMEIDYAVESEPLGTGGGLRLAMEKCSSEHVLALNGDTLFMMDLKDFAACYKHHQTPVGLTLRKVEDVSRYGSVVLDENNIIKVFGEKVPDRKPGLINAGIYLLNRDFYLRRTQKGNFSIEEDCFEQWLHEGLMAGFPYEAYFLDIGIPEDYLRAQDEFTKLAY